jgi:hypothetical protein
MSQQWSWGIVTAMSQQTPAMFAFLGGLRRSYLRIYPRKQLQQKKKNTMCHKDVLASVVYHSSNLSYRRNTSIC